MIIATLCLLIDLMLYAKYVVHKMLEKFNMLNISLIGQLSRFYEKIPLEIVFLCLYLRCYQTLLLKLPAFY